MSNPRQIQAAVRAYAIPRSGARKRGKPRPFSPKSWSKWTLIIYCSTHPDASQRLLFGGYQVYFRSELVEKGIFYADDLDDEERRHLIRLVRGLMPQTNPEVRLKIISRTTFLKGVFFKVAYKAKGAVVGIELPFHLSRLAVDWGEARTGIFAEGFSLILLEYEGKDGIRRPDAFFPRIGIKAIDSQRSLIGFTSAWRRDDSGSKSKGRSKRHPRGHFLDCLTLANAHTGARNNLHEACAAFGVGYSEDESLSKTEISVDTISGLLNRLDVIWELYQSLLTAHWRHPISLPPDKTYSSASIGKAYLREMNLEVPQLDISPEIDLTEREVYGLAMTSYFGGRAECRIRRVPVPVTYCDFQSMYPTVFNLMGIWELLTAEYVTVMDATKEVQNLLARIELDDLYKPSTWKLLTTLVEIQPENDVLPTRADFSQFKNGSLNNAISSVSSSRPLWYPLADAVASNLMTGKPPKIHRALRFGGKGRQRDLRKIKLLGIHEIDPYQDDLFQALVEARITIASEPSLNEAERAPAARGLKAIASATSYGIFIELHRKPRDPVEVDVYGLDAFSCEVEYVEEPGEFFFPIPATLMTGAARLMLAMLEEEVNRRCAPLPSWTPIVLQLRPRKMED